MARPTMRIIHSHGSTEDLLFRANQHLALGEAREALHLYTVVLYTTCPGHIFAFLNRACAYRVLGYPELAVTDAYRAAVASHEMRDMKSYYAGTRFNHCKRYLRAESLHVKANERWTESDTPGDREHPMARLTFNFAIPVAGVLGEGKKRAELCTHIEHFAIYRMCDALQQCGGGALADAIGIISDSCRMPASHEEKMQVWELGEELMEDIERRFREDEVPSQDSTRPTVTMKEMMKTKATLVNREVYPWNDHEPEPESMLTLPIREYSANCKLGLKRSEEGLAPTLELQAAEDILPATDVLYAKWSYIVASDEPFSLNDGIPPALPPLEDVHPCAPRSLYCHPKAQSLYDRILFLVLAHAVDKETHPLDNENIIHLSGGFHNPRAPTDTAAARERRKTLPWSFANNVVRPIHYIQSYTQEHLPQQGSHSHFFQLERYDGWVINTLLAKIQHSIRIQAGYKAVHPSRPADLPPERTPDRSPPSSPPLPRVPRRTCHRGTWVGTISALFSTIHVADTLKGEVPNVALDDSSGALLWAPEDDGAPPVRQEDRILRARDSFPGPESEWEDSDDEDERRAPAANVGTRADEAVLNYSDQAVWDSDETLPDEDAVNDSVSDSVSEADSDISMGDA